MYQNAELEIVRFNAEDVLATSAVQEPAVCDDCAREAIDLCDIEV